MTDKGGASPLPDFSQKTRREPQYSFLAVAELVETDGAVCVQGKISQLNQKGCYVNAANTLPVDTPLQIFISRDEETFVTRGKVIYVQEGFGMSIVFDDSTEDQVETFNSCLMCFANQELL